MTTSNDYQDPTSPNPSGAKFSAQERESFPAGEHWFEMTATLSPQSTARLGRWIEAELASLEDELSDFVTPGSLKKSLRR